MTPKQVAPNPIMDDGVKWTDPAITVPQQLIVKVFQGNNRWLTSTLSSCQLMYGLYDYGYTIKLRDQLVLSLPYVSDASVLHLVYFTPAEDLGFVIPVAAWR